METNIGTLTIDGRDSLLMSADCTLFVGRLDVEFDCGRFDGELRNLPFSEALEYSSLRNSSISISDCLNAKYENSIFPPQFTLNDEEYLVMSLAVDSVGFCPKSDRLSLNSRFTAVHTESRAEIVASLVTSAECYPITRLHVLMCNLTIPIRFANRYLPFIGVLGLPDDPTRNDIVAKFGAPDDSGGGPHTKFGNIPVWIRYTLPEYFLRFQLESDNITHVTVMLRKGPFGL